MVKVRRKVRGRVSVRMVRKRVVHWHKTKITEGVPVTEGVANRAWRGAPDLFCGLEWKAGPCERPEVRRPAGAYTSLVTISNFLYLPGDKTLSGDLGAPPRVKPGTSLTFVNGDQQLNIRHTVTTCPLPCNGRYVANYPLADGVWDSSTLGYDAIDGGNPTPYAATPPNLKNGRYAYFCRIHPWMRGEFEVG
jgi:plastocyanin